MSHNDPAKIIVSPTVPLLLALFVLLSSPLVLGALLLAALTHELGHCAMLRWLQARVTAVRITALGAEMRIEGRLSYGGEVLAAAAGPAVNLLLAPLLAYGGHLWEMLYLFAGTQLVLGLFNLLPILPLDGGSMLWNLLAWITEPYTADRVMTAVGFGTAAVLTLAAIWAAWQGGGFFFLLAALGLLWQPLGQIGVAKPLQSG